LPKHCFIILQSDKRSRLSNPDYHVAKLQEINQKIEDKKQQLSIPDQFSNVKQLSR